ncbi:FAD-dependent monooxygenase [Zavarzinia compransoris]|uniref:FAD-dependent monooxygenase n=1 Tax=Zavarzinia marina TaxID=2911065 RepID=UPI001F17B8B0|nr:FAD-dependent monooxygenase [Zavarzinia marina]MCF4167057.1 FAD-dependent monooxygenase [Zavarzinia marina]
MNDQTRRILIAGAGLGGLCAALCLRRLGFEVEVLERAPELAEVGAGIQVAANGSRVLADLELLDDVRRLGFEPEAAEIRDGVSGFTCYRSPLRGAHERRYGRPYVQIHRADLHGILLGACMRAGVGVTTDAPVEGYERLEDGVALRLASGREIEGDVLIGADGIHSAVRAAMLGREQPRFTGQVAWRGTVPAERLRPGVVPETAGIWVGPGRHFVHYYLRGGRLVNFVAVQERAAWREESWTTAGDVGELRAAFAGWHDAVGAILEQVESTFLWGLFGRDRLPRWTDGPVALLGDACHPMLPFMAQGACMAFEDAAVLARCLAGGGDAAGALKRYERLRIDRATRVQRQAEANARLFHVRNRAAQVLRLGAIWAGTHLLPPLAAARFDWLYGHDAAGDAL